MAMQLDSGTKSRADPTHRYRLAEPSSTHARGGLKRREYISGDSLSVGTLPLLG